MATTSAPNNLAPSYSGRALCRIVGIACLAGFIIDVLILALPPSLGSAEWRIGFLQQVSDRSIILLFGAALTLYGSLEARALRKQLGTVCLAIGVAYLLSCVLVIRDGLTLNDLAVKNITTQATQVQTQIEKAKNDPKAAPNITPEQLQQAAQTVDTRAISLKQNAKTGILKTAIAIVGNLVVIGVALISLGRYGMRSRKS
ncbi:MAG: HpsJ family protein [Tildeniella nuda ZEHNDER 1965/U140]|jgi:predicted PurR-regulated permease PerM|nr:HpsJ family protein [Tildeniella nuda ZEHNDER 1965/U140]